MQKIKQVFSNNSDENVGSSPTSSPRHSTANTVDTSALGANRTSDAGVGAKGLGRDPVAHSTGHESMTHGNLGGHSSTGSGAVTGAGATTAGNPLTGNNLSSTGNAHQSTGETLKEKLTGGHTFGHDARTDNKFDPAGENTTHDHKHLQHVVHDTHRHMEVEEVQRERDHHRHVHHLQHHVQPVLDTQVKDEVHHHNKVPVTNIVEKHANTEEDHKLFQSLGEKHRDQETHLPKERTVVDLGEKVNEITHHHVHHVTQPVVQREVHDKHRIHTTIPLSHTVHEAPIIHKSSMHEPVHMTDFLKGGGKLDSGVNHSQSGILSTGECDRTVDGIGEKMAADLNLKPSSFGHHGTTGTTNTSSSLTGGSHNTSSLTGTGGNTSSLTGTGGNTSSLTGTGANTSLTGTGNTSNVATAAAVPGSKTGSLLR